MNEEKKMVDEMDMEEVERICRNCSSFFTDINDSDMGVCMVDDVFDPYAEEICEGLDFSCCYTLYQQKRYSGDTEACDQFEEPEVMEVPEGMDLSDFLYFERMKVQKMDDFVPYLYDVDSRIINNAISTISSYVNMDNPYAYEVLIKYYLSLDPAETLDDVSMRIKIVESLCRHESNRKTIEAYVHELARTPSNNTTRKLYTLLLRRLCYCDEEIVQELLIELLNKKQFSYKIKQRIEEVAGL